MWLAYFDESKENNQFFVYSALLINAEQWNEAFAAVKTSDLAAFGSRNIHQQGASCFNPRVLVFAIKLAVSILVKNKVGNAATQKFPLQLSISLRLIMY
jgi:hypothetical protein